MNIFITFSLDKPEIEEPELGPKGLYFDADKSDRKPTREEQEADEDEERKELERLRFGFAIHHKLCHHNLSEQRLAELKAKQQRNKFGRVFQITEPDYKTEVTEASAEADVILLLTCNGFYYFYFQIQLSYFLLTLGIVMYRS